MFSKIVHKISMSLNTIALVLLGVLALMTSVDVMMRYFFNHPIKGTVEITEVLLVTFGALTIANTQRIKGHIEVDMFVARLPRRAQLVIRSLMYAGGLFIFALMSYFVVKQGFSSIQSNLMTDLLEIPIGPFKIILAFGVGVLCLELVIDLATMIRELVRGKA